MKGSQILIDSLQGRIAAARIEDGALDDLLVDPPAGTPRLGAIFRGRLSRPLKATGARIVELLERRLDNLVFRAGFAPTIPAARQLVNHGHVAVNGRRATIPSMRLAAGDAFGPGEKAQPRVRESLADPALERPEWIVLDASAFEARLAHLPEGGDSAPFPLDLQRVVEYYAKRL